MGNNIKMDFKEISWDGRDLINLVEDWDKWQAAIKMATTYDVQSCSKGTPHINTVTQMPSVPWLY
jgi:hypothetical protein